MFYENGRVDPHATEKNGVKNVNMSMAPLPQDFKKNDALAARKALEIALTPPSKDEFAILITALTAHCGMQSKHPQAVRMMIADYWQDFGHYPKALIEAACAKWRKKTEGNDWMPGSGDMIKLMAPEMYKLQKMQDRVKIMLGEKVEKNSEEKRSGMVSLASVLGV